MGNITPPQNQAELVENGTTMQVGSVTVPGIYRARSTGGEVAPKKRTEKGYSYSTRVGSEPVEFVFEAKVTANTLNQLRALRDRKEPFSVSVKSMTLTACKLSDLKIIEEGQQPNVYTVTITIEEIQQATTGTSTVQVQGVTGSKTKNNPNGEGSSGESPTNPSVAQSETKQTTDDGGGNDDGGWLDSLVDGFTDAFSGGDNNDDSN